MVRVGLEARHSDLGSLAVQSLDAYDSTFCPARDARHPLGLNVQVKDGESFLIQLSDLCSGLYLQIYITQ